MSYALNELRQTSKTLSFEHSTFNLCATPVREVHGPYLSATGIYEISGNDIIITTPGDLFRFENNQFKDKQYYQFCATAFSYDHNILFGATRNPTTIFALDLYQIGHPLVSDQEIEQNDVKKMFFFEKSKCLVIVADSIRSYKVEFNPFTITLDKIFSNEIVSNDMSFADFENENLYLSTNDGYSSFDLNGARSNSSQFLDVIQFFKGDYIDLMIFDNEHVLMIDNNLSVYLINIKTKIKIEVIQLPEHPNRFYRASKKRIAFSFEGKVGFYEINVFWKAWISSIDEPRSIVRWNKLKGAARILVQNDNSTVLIASPRDGLEIAKVETPNESIDLSERARPGPSQYFYDRGYFIYTSYNASTNSHQFRIKNTTQRDRLFMISKEGFVSVFNTNVWPFKEIAWKNARAVSMTVCKYENTWFYVVATLDNELLLMNTHNFEFIKSFQITGPPILRIEYYFPTNLILIIRELEVAYYDLKKNWPVSRTAVPKFSAIKANADLLYLGFPNGSVERIKMGNRALKTKDRIHKVHSAPIIDFAFSSSFWLSASEDGAIYVWSYSLHTVTSRIQLPTSINCLGILNGLKDVVVGIDTAIMILDRDIFTPKPEKEAKSVDYYDQYKDRFVPISAEDPVKPSDYIVYKLYDGQTEFPISINTFNTPDPHEIRPPSGPKTKSARSIHSKFNFDEEMKQISSSFGLGNNENISNKTDEFSTQGSDIVELNEDRESTEDSNGNEDNSIHDSYKKESNSYQSENSERESGSTIQDVGESENENNNYSKTTDFSKPTTIPLHTLYINNNRTITAPLITGATGQSISSDDIFANTQPDHTMNKSMRAFANDADSDSDDDEIFKAKFPLRMKSPVVIESQSYKKRATPYIPIPTDLYTTSVPKIIPRANPSIVVPKAPESPRKMPLSKSDMFFTQLYLKNLSHNTRT